MPVLVADSQLVKLCISGFRRRFCFIIFIGCRINFTKNLFFRMTAVILCNSWEMLFLKINEKLI